MTDIETIIYKNDNTLVWVEILFKPNEERKTFVYTVKHKRGGTVDILGYVKWYGAWRQYVFMPVDATLWNDSCLQGIVDYLQKINKEHRSKRGKG